MAVSSTIRDASQAPAGEAKIEWAAQHMPVLSTVGRRRLSDGALKGSNVAVVAHLEAKTACLALELQKNGARVVVAGSNPASTQDDVAAALVKRGVSVFATRGASREEFDRQLRCTLETHPDFVIDDGAELVSRIHEAGPGSHGVRGASEETTTGVLRLKALERAGLLSFPVVAANDARCKHMFENRYGTGQSSLTALMAATNLLVAGKTLVVVGYGWCGRGLARYADGLGARAVVCEVDPVRALEAVADGFAVMPLAQACAAAEWIVTATGSLRVVREEHFAWMRDGVVLANAGNYAHEIDVAALERIAARKTVVRQAVEEYRLADGRRLRLVAGGGLVNIAAGDGHPIEIMDLSFTVQACSLHHLVVNHSKLERRVHNLPPHVDEEIAGAMLATYGVSIDSPTAEQEAYRASWQDPQA